MRKPSIADIDDAIARLGLEADGAPFRSLSSLVCPVIFEGRPAFLKVTNELEELAGGRALKRWNGKGAIQLLASDANAIVLERAGGTLRALVTDDVTATQVLCDVVSRLHSHSPEDLDEFPTLRRWFSSLFADTTPRFDQVRAIAAGLLDRFPSLVLLHGDLHHENVLDGGARGWLAIDPKGIAGPREFDYCNIFTNWTPQEAIGRFDVRLRIVAKTAGIDHACLLRWIASWSALSGIWHLEDDKPGLASFPHAITDLALDRLHAYGA